MGDAYRKTGELKFIIMVLFILIDILLFVLSCVCSNHKTKQDIEELLRKLGFSDICADVYKLSEEEFIERYGIKDDF